jgi:hypothetical protein
MKHAVATMLVLVLAAPASGDDAPPPGPVPQVPRLALDLEIFAAERIVRRTGPDLTELRVDRAEAGAGIALGPRASAGLRLEAVRSAGEGGALGVDGDSLVVRIKRAQLAGDYALGGVRLDGAIGVVADPWIGWLDDGYSLRPLSATASERLLDWSTSDLAVRIGAGYGPVHLAATIGNGEGLRYPERNDGQTTTGVLDVVALDRRDARLAIAAMGRDGSIGPARVRDRRLGGGFAFASPWVRAGGEIVRAWGIGERGELVGTVLGGWAEATIIDHLLVGARGATVGYVGGRASTFGGAIAVEPWHEHDARLRLWLAVDRTTASGTGAPLPGADAGEATTIMLLASATAPYVIP